jgi:hypothetical protein
MDLTIKFGNIDYEKYKPNKFKIVKGKSGRTWLYGICDAPAAHIYVSAEGRENMPGYRGFRGFGGSTLKFELEDGNTISLQGPWHSNSNALFNDTGIDLNENTVTYVVVSEKIGHDKKYHSVAINVLYKDEEPAVGSFDRGNDIALEWANKLGKPVHLYCESLGGSSSGFVNPGKKKEKSKYVSDISEAQLGIITS